MLNFVYLRSFRLIVLHFLAWFMHCQQGGEVWAWNGLLDAFRRSQVVSSHFWALVCTGLTGQGQRSDRSECWSCAHVGHRSERWWWPVWPVWDDVVAAALFSSSLHAFIQGEVHWFRGSLHVCRGALCGFSSLVLVVCALCFSFVLSQMCRAVALA
jgi:hypothetical protein